MGRFLPWRPRQVAEVVAVAAVVVAAPKQPAPVALVQSLAPHPFPLLVLVPALHASRPLLLLS
jgi:hypothetical protein